MAHTDFDIASSDGTRLQGRSWATPEPIAVINLIHGLGEHRGRYAHLAAFFNTQNITVHAIDLHGHGQTEGKRGVADSVDILIDDVQALLAYSRLQNPNSPHILMGHSMGGNVVLSFGLKNPQSAYKAVIAQAPLIAPFEKVPAILKTVVAGIPLQRLIPTMSW